MKIKKGQRLQIKHSRKGKLIVIAQRDFDTNEEWYPVLTTEPYEGNFKRWGTGEVIPCRGMFCSDIQVF